MNNPKSKRETLLKQMGEIETMSRGKLTEEYRERNVDGKTIKRGPYYKYQVWEDGRNKSRRVKADEAQQLRQGIEGLDKFKKLSSEYIDATIELTEQERGDEADSKKNSR